MDEMREREERKPPKGKGRTPWIVWAAALACGLGLAAVALRFEVTPLESSALLLDRWTGGVTFVRGDGSVSCADRGPRAVNPAPRQGPGGLPAAGSSSAPKGGKAAAQAPGKPKGPEGPGATGVSSKGSSPFVLCIRIPFLKKNPAPGAAKPAKAALEPPPFGKKKLEHTGAQVAPTVTWKRGKLRYRVVVEPFTEALKRLRQGRNPTFLIDLVDGSGFAVRSIRVSLPEMWIIRDEKDRIAGLELAGSIPLGQEEYLAIRDWRIRKED